MLNPDFVYKGTDVLKDMDEKWNLSPKDLSTP